MHFGSRSIQTQVMDWTFTTTLHVRSPMNPLPRLLPCEVRHAWKPAGSLTAQTPSFDTNTSTWKQKTLNKHDKMSQKLYFNCQAFYSHAYVEKSSLAIYQWLIIHCMCICVLYIGVWGNTISARFQVQLKVHKTIYVFLSLRTEIPWKIKSINVSPHRSNRKSCQKFTNFL